MIKPTGHHILVEIVEPETVTPGGIIIPDSTVSAERGASEVGRVIAVGPTAYMAEGLGGKPWCNAGDLVYFAKYAGKEVKDPTTKKSFLLLLDTDVVGLIEEEHNA